MNLDTDYQFIGSEGDQYMHIMVCIGSHPSSMVGMRAEPLCHEPINPESEWDYLVQRSIDSLIGYGYSFCGLCLLSLMWREEEIPF